MTDIKWKNNVLNSDLNEIRSSLHISYKYFFKKRARGPIKASYGSHIYTDNIS